MLNETTYEPRVDDPLAEAIKVIYHEDGIPSSSVIYRQVTVIGGGETELYEVRINRIG